MDSIETVLKSIATNIRASLASINEKLVAKGQPEAADLYEVPSLIGSINGDTTVLDLISNLGTYKDSVSINGKTLENIFGSQTYFSNTDLFTFHNSYYENEIISDDGAEKGTALLLTKTSVGSAVDKYKVLSIDTNVPITNSDTRTYLIAMRAKSTKFIEPGFAPSVYFNTNATGVERDGVGATYRYQDCRLWDNWQIYYIIFRNGSNNYFSDCHVALSHISSDKVKPVYLDWIMGFDITGLFNYTPREGVLYGVEKTDKAIAVLDEAILDSAILA